MKMKYTVTLVVILIWVAIGCVYYQVNYSKHYLVKLIFCDGRPDKQVLVKIRPNEDIYEIDNYKTAVPDYHGYLNVCEVHVIKEIPKP